MFVKIITEQKNFRFRITDSRYVVFAHIISLGHISWEIDFVKPLVTPRASKLIKFTILIDKWKMLSRDIKEYLMSLDDLEGLISKFKTTQKPGRYLEICMIHHNHPAS